MHNREIFAVFIAVGVFVAMTAKYLLEDIAPAHSIPLILEDNLRITPVPCWGYHTTTALVWSFIMLLHAFDNRERIFTAISGVAGLFCALMIPILTTNTISFASACIMAAFGLIYVGLMKLVDDRKLIEEGIQPQRLDFGEAFHANMMFGMGLLIPFGLEHGFYIALVIPLVGYFLTNLVLCLFTFGILHTMLFFRRLEGSTNA
jgi:hypothetical protein